MSASQVVFFHSGKALSSQSNHLENQPNHEETFFWQIAFFIFFAFQCPAIFIFVLFSLLTTVVRHGFIQLTIVLLTAPHCNIQTWQTFQYAKDGLTEQHKSLTLVQKMIKICELQG